MLQHPPLADSAYRLSSEQVLRTLRVRADQGLSNNEVTRRRHRFGWNIIPQDKKFRVLHLAFDRFRDVLVLILVAAALVSIALRHYSDAIIIAIAIGIDAVMGFAQIWRTERTLTKLREQIKDTTTVVRQGRLQRLPSDQLVVGDIIKVRAGEKIPADSRIVHAEGLRVREAILTGEAAEVEKDTAAMRTRTPLGNRKNMLFAGTSVVDGQALAVVTATGTDSEFGKIAQMIRGQGSPTSPLRKKLQQLGWRIGVAITTAIAVLVGLNLWRGGKLAATIETAVTLVVSAIPEDLTMILTIAMTVGVVRILRHKGVVRRLASGESLGSATVICTDKTGTLTQGKMKAVAFDYLQGDMVMPTAKPAVASLEQLAFIGFNLATDARQVNGSVDPLSGSATERAVLTFTRQLGFDQIALERQWRIRDRISFDTRWKYRAALADHPTNSTRTLFVSGAPEVLLHRSSAALNEQGEVAPLTSERRHQLSGRINELAGQGQRLVGIAVRRHLTVSEITHHDIHDLLFLGTLIIEDPIRIEARQAIAEAQAAGVSVKIVTGDHAATATAVARRLGLTVPAEAVVTGDDMHLLTDQQLQQRASDTIIFARVEPLDKQRIIRALQNRGHIVAMTGDGINDAVALKSADVGVAMASGSDIARDAADLVLIDNSFATIVAAIREGRVVRDNIRKVIAFLLATNAAEVAIFFVSLLGGLPLPLLPAQILWINLVTDGTSDIALSFEPAERNSMAKGPASPQAPLLDRTIIGQIIFASGVVTVAIMALYWYLLQHLALDLAYARTMTFTFVSLAALLSVWSFRSLQEPIIHRGLWQNRWILPSAIASLGLHLLAIYVPGLRSFFHTVALDGWDWLIVAVLAVLTVATIELRKVLIIPSKHTAPSPTRTAWTRKLLPDASL